MIRLFLLPIVITFALQISAGSVLAFDHRLTHPALTKLAIKKSTINTYLKNNLDLVAGTETIIDERSIIERIKEGSSLEDEPDSRASNHFHDPRKDWIESGMEDMPLWLEWYNGWSGYPREDICSAVHWATRYTEPAPDGAKVDTANQWDWDHARLYYYRYLTGIVNDSNIGPLILSDEGRKAYLAKSLRSLGQVTHLLQDMAVPAHVRNDFQSHLDWGGITENHLFPPSKWIGEKFEYFVEKHIKNMTIDSFGGDLTGPALTDFWDINSYVGQDPDDLDSLTIGLAEYTNMNFASRNTIFSEGNLSDNYPYNDVYYHPYPKKSSTNIDVVLAGNGTPETITAEDNKADKKIYIAKNRDGEVITHFAVTSYFTAPIWAEFTDGVGVFDVGLLYNSLIIDEECANEYASKLLPRAVGYSAALMDYFFRGEMVISVAPVFFSNTLVYLVLNIKNITSTLEAMKDGTFSVLVRHIIDKPEEEEDEVTFVHSYDVPSGEIQYGETGIRIIVSLPLFDSLSQDLYKSVLESENESIDYTVTFKGTLGKESNAVVGKFINQPGEVIFDEKWDELSGSYPWVHIIDSDLEDPDNGEGANEVTDSVLVKSNMLYIGHDSARCNNSILDCSQPVSITPNTYIEYKIDDFTINAQPPASEGNTNAWQFIQLSFSDNFSIQLSLDGQGVYLGPKTAYYNFTPGIIMVENIYNIFQNCGIAIPEELNLERIAFVQQFSELGEPATMQYEQSMAVDFIRLVEAGTTTAQSELE